MLTQSERKWCKKRQKINNSPLQEPWVLAPEFVRMAFNEMHEAREAAEFEAMVAAKLAERCVLLEKVVQKALGAAEYINLSAAAENALKVARLQVEEEMEKCIK